MDKLRALGDAVSAFLHSRYFDARHKTKVHIVQITLVVIIFVSSGIRVQSKPKGMPTRRSETIGIVMGIKTIIVLLYQILSSHVEYFRRWASLKAYAVLNSLEVLFWFVVVIVTFMTISTFCQGLYCGMGFMIALDAIILVVLALWTSIASIRTYRTPLRDDFKGGSDGSEIQYNAYRSPSSQNPRHYYHPQPNHQADISG